jgi:hypothetical protein
LELGGVVSTNRIHPALALQNADRALEVVEKNTDTSWAMFQAITTQQERGFEKTRPAGLDAAAGAARGAAAAVTLDDVLVEVRRNNRVCPLPTVWMRLYALLPNKPAKLAPVPATRDEWSRMPSLQKRARLREHIEWAATQGVLAQVHEVLRALPEAKWHHMGE